MPDPKPPAVPAPGDDPVYEGLCRRCEEVPPADDSFGLCRLCLLIERRTNPTHDSRRDK